MPLSCDLPQCRWQWLDAETWQHVDGEANGRALVTLLAWYSEMGVEAALDDVPTDWTARGNEAPGAAYVWPERPAENAARQGPAAEPRQTAALIPAQNPRPAAALQSAPIRSFAPAAATKAAASAPPGPVIAASLSELEAALHSFDGCGLKATAKNLCLYRGAPQADLMIIGEAPGREEDLSGKPFVGPAGQLLDKMLAAIGRSEANVHITNVVYWRPPGNRTPSLQEVQACAPFLARQIELVAPQVVLLLGAAAGKQMLASDEGITRLRGKWKEIMSGGHKIPAMATLHPAYVLRVPASKRQVWRDLLAVRQALDLASN